MGRLSSAKLAVANLARSGPRVKPKVQLPASLRNGTKQRKPEEDGLNSMQANVAPAQAPKTTADVDVTRSEAPGEPGSGVVLLNSFQYLKPQVHQSGRPPAWSRPLGRKTRQVRVRQPEDRDRYGEIYELRAALGLQTPIPKPTTLLAIDTESERAGLLDHVVEIGVTILDTADIEGTSPGAYGRDWLAKTKHHHFVINLTRQQRARMRGSFFGRSKLLSVSGARAAVEQILRSLDPSKPVALVGHGIFGDIKAMMHCPRFQFDLLSSFKDCKITLDSVFDTYHLAHDIRDRGARLESSRLGYLIHDLGVDPKYLSETGQIMGTHNASNDAAYTMMALILFATRWEQLIAIGRRRTEAIQSMES